MGKSAQYAGRELSSSRYHVAVPWDRATELQVSPVLILYVEPVHVGLAADEAVVVTAESEVVLGLVSSHSGRVRSVRPTLTQT